MEADMKAIAEGSKDSQTVLKEQLDTMHRMFTATASKKDEFKAFFHEKFKEERKEATEMKDKTHRLVKEKH